ncbi:MAG: VTT domain-containing protein [Acidobacteriaceae bacterium]|nr:VTT domain-containing protein [Acidobacteriaceae bacterium]
MMASSQLTYGGLLLAVFGNQVCLPIPSVVFLMAAGALSAHGHMRVGISVFLGVVGCLVADGIWFWLGRQWGSKALRLLCRLTIDPKRCSKQAHEKFARHGLRILCVAKFFPGLDGILPPLVGAEGTSVAAFLIFDTFGSFLWCGFYVLLGYLLAEQVELGIRWAERFGTLVAITIGAPIAAYAGWRGLALLRMIRRLRLRRISAPMLARKLKSQKRIAVLDLLNFDEEPGTETFAAVPGAMRIEPSRLKNSPRLTVPDDVEIVLYSSSGGHAVSARAALALKRIGVDKVWVLEGGLNAWRDHGFPVSRDLEEPEVIAERLGVKLPNAVTSFERR